MTKRTYMLLASITAGIMFGQASESIAQQHTYVYPESIDQQPTYVYRNGFEPGSGSLSPQSKTSTKGDQRNTQIVYKGAYSFEASLSKNEFSKGFLRCEVSRNHIAKRGDTRWWGFAMYVPADHAYDKVLDIVHQIKTGPATNVSLVPLGALLIDKDKWVFRMQVDNKTTVGWSESVKSDKGKWTFWVFHAKFDTGAKGGFMQIWKDGQKVVDKTNVSTLDPDAPSDLTLRFGIYKAGYKSSYVSSRVLYYDTITIADKNANYNFVDPANQKY